MEASPKLAITAPIAFARRSSGTASLTMDNISAPRIPPKKPVTERVINRILKLGANAQANVPMENPMYTESRLFRLSNRSMKNAPANPAIPAVNE
jgi:hypothetical protein